MILLRRLVAVLLALLFIPLFLVSLVVLRVNGTLLEPAFYQEQLRDADFFPFLFDEVLPLAVDEALSGDTEIPAGLNLSGEVIAARVRQVVPPEWLQRQAEGALDEVVPYLTGDTDGFLVTVSLSERADAALVAVQDTIRDADLAVLLYEEVLPDALGESFGESVELPLGMSLTQADAIAALKRVFPPEWIEGRANDAVDEVGPYLTGRTEGFTLTVPLSDRADAALGVVGELLQGADLQGFLLDELIGPAIERELGAGISLPLGLTLTSGEIRDSLDQVFTEEWVREQTGQVVEQIGPYVTGAAPGFEITLPISDRAAVAVDVLGDILDGKLQALVNETPTCTLPQLLRLAAAGLPEGRPECLPPGASVALFLTEFGLDVAGELGTVIAGRFVDDLTYTDADLAQSLSGTGSDVLGTLDKIRETIRDGFTFTEGDLRRVLTEQGDEGLVDTLDQVRETIRDGFTFTEADLLDALSEEGGASAVDDVERYRGLLGTARGLWLLLPAALAVALAVIGVLGGRGVGGKLAWAGIVLTVASAVGFVGVVVGRRFAEARLDELRVEQLAGAEPISSLLIEKGFAVGQAVAADFLSGITTVALLLLAIGLAASGVGLAWPALRRRSQTPGGDAPRDSGDAPQVE